MTREMQDVSCVCRFFGGLPSPRAVARLLFRNENVRVWLRCRPGHICPGSLLAFPNGGTPEELFVAFQDRSLTCRDCGAEFVFTAGEQEFYAQKGFEHEPT